MRQLASSFSRCPLADRLRRAAGQLLAGCLLAGCLISSGCLLPYRVGLTSTGAPKYNRLEINYEVQGGGGAGMVSQAHRPVQMVDLTQLDEGLISEEGWASARLKVEYPHPEGLPDTARATLRLSRRPPETEQSGWFGKRLFARTLGDQTIVPPVTPSVAGMNLPEQRAADDEIWVLDFPKQQLDLLLADVANSGFFDNQMRPSGGTQLSIEIDRGSASKTWSSEPRLEDLIDRVRREGWLAGFTPARGGAIR